MDLLYSQYAWLIPLFPLVAFLIGIAIGRGLSRTGTWISIVAAAASLVLAILVFIEHVQTKDAYYHWNYTWLEIGKTKLTMGIELNHLNALMLLVVTAVSLLVQVYSLGYMKHDERISLFYGYISLFTFSMLGLVVSENLIQLYVFWELVGVCSFLLIGFWFHKPEARAAAQKAFIVTRIGDVGLFIAILILFWHVNGHALDFNSLHNAVINGDLSQTIITWAAILIFVGAMGKSGQFPLHTWLPDAMEGPTPISALIHAATMVAAGVYLVARTFDLFQASQAALDTVAYVGAFTAIFAATIGLAQNDIKRILAYSTISQLGYMMMALGIGSMTAGIFHLFTHAFFKALLFLAAGSVIHAVNRQNIHEMGGLGRGMKLTAWTFAIGALGLSGIPPFSGFWSKDAILMAAYDRPVLLAVGLAAAFFTAFYMSRLFFLVFTGKNRSNEAAHESPAVMTWPLIILAALTVVSGFIYTPFNDWLGSFLGDADSEHFHLWIALASTAIGLCGIALGWLIYGKRSVRADLISRPLPWLATLVSRKYYIDELYQLIIVVPLKAIGTALKAVDAFVIDGLVGLTAGCVSLLGRSEAKAQNGQVQTYGLVTLLSFLILAVAIAGRRFW